MYILINNSIFIDISSMLQYILELTKNTLQYQKRFYLQIECENKAIYFMLIIIHEESLTPCPPQFKAVVVHTVVKPHGTGESEKNFQIFIQKKRVVCRLCFV